MDAGAGQIHGFHCRCRLHGAGLKRDSGKQRVPVVIASSAEVKFSVTHTVGAERRRLISARAVRSPVQR